MDYKSALGLHLPKCAGTSILRAVEAVLRPEKIYQSTSLIKNYNQNKKEVFEITNWHQIKFIFGHHVFDEMLKLTKKPYLFTFIRDPIDRHVSNFRFVNRLRADLRAPIMSFEEYAENSDNNLCDFILKRFPAFNRKQSSNKVSCVAEILSHFDFVGSTADLQNFEFPSTLRNIFGCESIVVGVENAAVEALDLESSDSVNLVNRIQEKFADEIELYSMFKDAAGRGVGKPFYDSTAVKWRNDSYIQEPLDFRFLDETFAKYLYWEYRNFGVLDQFVESIPRVVSFLKAFEEFDRAKRYSS